MVQMKLKLTQCEANRGLTEKPKKFPGASEVINIRKEYILTFL